MPEKCRNPDPAEIRVHAGLTVACSGWRPEPTVSKSGWNFEKSLKWPLTVMLLMVLAFFPASTLAGSVNDCHGVRYAYSAKGWNAEDVPRQPRQGRHGT